MLSKIMLSGRVIAILASLGGCAADASGSIIAPPFAVDRFVKGGSRIDGQLRRGCPAPINPAIDMAHMGTFYGPQKSQSVIDRQQMAAYVARNRAVDDMKQRLMQLQQLWAGDPASQHGTANCIAAQLRAWASAKALLSGIDDNDDKGHRQAILIIAWAAPGLASAYQIAQRSGALDDRDRRLVAGWAAALSKQIRDEFSPRVDRLAWLSSISNHNYWGAAAVAALASVTQSSDDFDWAIGELHRAIAAAEPGGGWSRELARGGRALHYQNFALQAVAMLVRSADANGRTLTRDEEQKLDTIVRFTAAAWRDPRGIERRTGARQEKSGDMLGWIDIMLDHLARHDPAVAQNLDALAKPYRPFASGFVGLDLTEASGVAAANATPKPPRPGQPTAGLPTHSRAA